MKGVDTIFKYVRKEKVGYYIGMISIFLLGLGLRIYHLKDQILLDDEWHGLHFIKGKSFGEILSQINPYQNSSPVLNIYRYLCYHTIGLSEWNLRFPLLVTGSLLVILIPLSMRRHITDRASMFYSLMLALSPFLIFYSRFSRSYIIITFLSLLSLLASFEWLRTNKHRYAIGFIVASVFSVYTHLSSVGIVLTVYFTCGMVFLLKRVKQSILVTKTIKVPIKVLFIYVIIHAFILVLVMFNFIKHRSSLPLNMTTFSGGDLLNMLSLLSGSAIWGMVVFVIFTAVLGFIYILKQNALLAILFAMEIVVNIGFIWGINPFGIESSAVFMRYCIGIIPIILCFAAVGIDQGISRFYQKITSTVIRMWITGAVITGLGIVLFFFGPLPVIYRTPNNFTNHLAYQGAYSYNDWQKSKSNHYFPSYEISVDQMPDFYRKLALDPISHAIIEYPFDFADHSNLLYFYQIHHRKRVFAGYCSDNKQVRVAVSPQMMMRMKMERLTTAFTRPEIFLTDRKVKARTHFRNMMDISDTNAISASGADFIVLHKVIQSIYFKGEEMGNFPLYDKSVTMFKKQFKQKFDDPVFEDDQIVVFALKKK